MAQIQANVRTETGKTKARALRREGFVPGVVYGPNKETLHVFVDSSDLTKLIHDAGNELLQLDVDGETRTVLLQDVEREPVRGDVLHVDFYEVPLDKEITTTVPVILVGQEERANDGGILVESLREIEVACLPTNIPHSVDVDVSKLGMGDSINVGDVAFPEGVNAVTPADETVVSVVAPTEEPAEEAEVPAEGEELVPEAEEGAPAEEAEAEDNE